MKTIKIICLSLLILTTKFAFGQCDIKVDRTEDLITVFSGRETIHKTEDFENGYLTAGISMINYINKKDKDKVDMEFGIFTYVGSLGEYKLIKPRRLTLNFLGGLQLQLVAETMEKLDMQSDANFFESFYPLNEEQVKLIKQEEIFNITIWDNRTEQVLICKPYKFILKEQLECILKNY